MTLRVLVLCGVQPGARLDGGWRGQAEERRQQSDIIYSGSRGDSVQHCAERYSHPPTGGRQRERLQHYHCQSVLTPARFLHLVAESFRRPVPSA